MMARLPEIYAGGEVRRLGHVPVPGRRKLARMMAASDILPESALEEFDLTTNNRVIPIRDQNGIGACNGHAASTSLEWARWLDGMAHVDLSPWFAYAIMCRGIDQGSNIGDALKLLRSKGTCKFDSVAYKTYNPNRLTAANYAEALNYRLQIGDSLTNFDQMLTATMLRRPFNFSICVGNNFNPGSNGIVGYTRGPGNHAVCGGLGIRFINNKPYIIWQNSWTTSWGKDGYAYVGREHIDGQPYFECYTVNAGFDLAGDPNNPPPDRKGS